MRFHELGLAVADVEPHIIEPIALDLVVDRPGDDVARRKLGPLVIVGHEAMPGFRVDQQPAFAANGFGDQEILDLQIVEAGRVELHEFHVRHPASRPPGHRNAVPGRPARSSREKIGAPGAAAGQDRRPRAERLHPLLPAAVGVESVDVAAGRKVGRVAAGDEVDGDHVGDERDVRLLGCGGFQRLLHRTARRVGDMDDPAVAVPALAGQMERLALGRERDAELHQPRDRSRRLADDIFDDPAVVEPGAGDHRVVDVRLERVAFFQHGGDSALRPVGRAFADRALGDHSDLPLPGEVQRRGEPRRPGADDEDVEVAAHSSATRLRNTSSRSGSRVDTSTIPSPSAVRALST
jgi:hypothetical protein